MPMDEIIIRLALRCNGQTITLTDQGRRELGAPPSNLKHCERGTWNECFTIETNYS